ncbi:MAG: hypothetical protein JSV42_08105 [Chloroflexota bacterium]|nr:MAG: hypothetical protein JSV42_08105 [Chloroflexota bacterium]
MSIAEIHARLANTAMIYCIIMAVWGLWRFFRKQGISGGYFGAVVVAEILLAAQGLFGLILWFGAAAYRPGWVHWLYGIVLLMGAPVVYAYTKGRQDRPEMLLYSVAFIIMVALVLRAMVTAAPPV